MISNDLIKKCEDLIHQYITTQNRLRIPLTINNVAQLLGKAFDLNNHEIWDLKWRLLWRFDLTTYDLDKPITLEIFNKSLRKYEREW